ncbi:hypothetical protein ACN47E_008630 [Coniothyrium glycines]
MKFPVIVAFLASISAGQELIPTRGATLDRRSECRVCVTTVAGSSTSNFSHLIPFESGGTTTRNFYSGCTVVINRGSSATCSTWRISTEGSCNTVTRQQTC